jgi:hypothetical protein
MLLPPGDNFYVVHSHSHISDINHLTMEYHKLGKSGLKISKVIL